MFNFHHEIKRYGKNLDWRNCRLECMVSLSLIFKLIFDFISSKNRVNENRNVVNLATHLISHTCSSFSWFTELYLQKELLAKCLAILNDFCQVQPLLHISVDYLCNFYTIAEIFRKNVVCTWTVHTLGWRLHCWNVFKCSNLGLNRFQNTE